MPQTLTMINIILVNFCLKIEEGIDQELIQSDPKLHPQYPNNKKLILLPSFCFLGMGWGIIY